MAENIIEMVNISKRFGDFYALQNVNFDLKKGEIHALLGENGAGKSTLMSILFGLYTPDEGKIYINGKEANIKDPNIATDLGIGMVHQHFKLVHNFTVLENIILGAETVRGGFLKIDEARKKVKKLSADYGLAINPDALIMDISVGQQQRVEILKMLYRDNEILIFDEPTAVLTPQEIDELMAIMEKMRQDGKSIIFISHKLDEIKKVSDRASILRKGKMIGTVQAKDASKEELSRMMVGRKVTLTMDKKETKISGENLILADLWVKSSSSKEHHAVKGVSFSVRGGEITTIAGIDGNGQSELAMAISGLIPIDKGSMILNGKDMTHSNIRQRNTSGFGHIPEDRHKFGLVLDFTLAENLALKDYFKEDFQKNGILNFPHINSYAKELIGDYDIRSSRGEKSVARGMSGGNQQKAIIARELKTSPDMILAVQPTRGLDVGAIEYIHKQIVAQRDMGKAVLLISFELDEVFSLSDRILVMYEGEIVADLLPQNTSREELGLYMSGVKRQNTPA